MNTSKNDSNFSTHALDQIIPQLDNLSLAHLQKLRGLIDVKAQQVEQRARDNAIRQIKEIATTVGMSIPDIIAFKAPGSEARYKHPNDATKTWTGKGRQPKWMTNMLDGSGATLDSLRA